MNRTEMLLQLKVSDIMSKDVVTVDYDDLIAKPARLMLENRMHSLLVLKYGKPAYIISSYDLIRVAYEDTFNKNPVDMLRTPVEELVKGQKLVSVEPDMSLMDALHVLTEYNIHSVPVIESGVVMGILTMMDLAKWYKGTHK
ncbi:MAG TPA: CBS domain-containing protein [Leptospiraceae bacterium]|nr:CBS domain-containing protein [Leptospiraceae bacterium]HMZ61166.1 CBS domain-containing protein [Leptospiraceae bacterium]HNF25354.1 CBS domain-containing protein [Leptospiraceae bacterium]HNI27535.1 CBS domain-containing protein [Leptospiraceae bacterium]HNI99032.1 CBS domain-containing protein [Leptospiraceae bacterium]